jgi:hypothetical protein
MGARGSAYDARVKGHIANGHNPKVAKTLAMLEVDPDENDSEDLIENENDQGKNEALNAVAKSANPPVPSTKPMVPNPHKPDMRPAEIKGSSDGEWEKQVPGAKQMGARKGGSFKAVSKRKSY